MFVVAHVVPSRTGPNPAIPVLTWPVIFEHPTKGYITDPVAEKGSREDAQALADGLNAVLDPAPAQALGEPAPQV